MIHLHSAQHREGRSGQVETGQPNAVGAAVESSLETTKSFFEADSRFPVPCSTEGSAAAKPNVFGTGSHCHHLPPYPSLTHLWSPCPSHPLPYNCSCLIPISGWSFLAQPCCQVQSGKWRSQAGRPGECSSLSTAPHHASLLVTLGICLLKREASCSSQQISELAKKSQGGVIRL